MANRPEELRDLLLKALASPLGLIVTVSGTGANRRQLAVSALSTTKRDLLTTHPNAANLQIKPIPGQPDKIAIKHIPALDFDEG